MNMARNMFKGIKFPIEYYVEAVACIIYVLNRSPMKIMMNKLLLKAWTCIPCSISHFRLYGCIAYAHIHKELRGKLDDKSEKCIFIRYSEHSKAHKWYNPITKNTIIN